MSSTGPTPKLQGRRLLTAACFAALVALLASSGLVRAWQDRRMAVAAEVAAVTPIKLAVLPRQIGGWKAVGPDIAIDAETIQVAGCSDYVNRVYRDERTGVTVTALVAYGPAEKIVGHSPAVCYPAVGYQCESGPSDRAIEAGGSKPLLRSFVFARSEAQARERLHVYAGFRHSGRWTPDSGGSRKRFRHEPGMFKVQIQRHLGAEERCDAGNPIEQFASALISELDRRLAPEPADAEGLAQDIRPPAGEGLARGHRPAREQDQRERRQEQQEQDDVETEHQRAAG